MKNRTMNETDEAVSEPRLLCTIGQSNHTQKEGKKFSEPPPKDGARAWVSCAAFFLTVFLNFGNARLLGMFAEEWARDFNIPRTFLMIGLGSPTAFLLYGFFSPAKIVFFAGIIASIGFVSIAFEEVVQSFPTLVIMNVLSFAGAGTIHTTAYICVAQWTHKYRPLAIGLGNMGSPVAGMILPRLFEFLRDEFGWRGVFLIAGGLFLNNCVAAMVLRRYSTPPPSEKTESDSTPKKSRFDLSIFRLCMFWFLPFYCLFHMGCMNGFLAYHPSMANILGLSETDKSNVLIFLGSSDLIARLILSIVITLPRVRRHLALLLLLNELVMALGSLWVGFAKDFANLVGASIVFGISYGGWFVHYFSYLAELATPSQLPTTVAICYIGGGISSLLLPPFAGFIADSVNQYVVVFYLFAGLLVVASTLLGFVFILQLQRDTYRFKIQDVTLKNVNSLSTKSDDLKSSPKG